MEVWNGYDKDGNVLDLKITRGQEIPDGVYHLVCDVLVQHIDGDILLMRRALNKECRPGEYEASAGGSAYYSEDSESCAKRELYEETGIKSENLQFIGRYFNKERHAIYDRYICITDINKNDIVFQEGETEDYKWVNLNEFKEFISTVKQEHRKEYYQYLCEKIIKG